MPDVVPPQSPDQPSAAQPPRLEYPVRFELRIIYLLVQGATLGMQVQELLQAHRISAGEVQSLPAKGSTYGRMSVWVSFESETQMHKAYAAMAALPGVKMVL